MTLVIQVALCWSSRVSAIEPVSQAVSRLFCLDLWACSIASEMFGKGGSFNLDAITSAWGVQQNNVLLQEGRHEKGSGSQQGKP